MGGEELVALQTRLHSVLGLDEVYSNPANQAVGTGVPMQEISLENANYLGAARRM